MKKEDKYFEYLKHRHKWHCITSFGEIPILILLYSLDYRTAFWILLSLIIVNNIIFGVRWCKLEILAGVEN